MTRHDPDLRHAAHRAFDRLWDDPRYDVRLSDPRAHKLRRRILKRRRRAAYAWLAHRLRMGMAHCHFALFDDDTAARALEICRAADPADVRREGWRW